MGAPVVFYKNLYDTYKKLGLPVENIVPSTDFTINNLKDLHPEVDWRAISGFRNVLVHDYLGINLERAGDK